MAGENTGGFDSSRMTPWRRDDDLKARHLDEPRRFLQRQHGSAAPPTQKQTDLFSGFEVVRLQVLDVRDDMLICRPIQTEIISAAGEVKVAKPIDLMKRTYDMDSSTVADRVLPDGTTIKYKHINEQKRKAIDVNDEDNTEIQVIVPAYVKGDNIFAMLGVAGGTGLDEVVEGTNTSSYQPGQAQASLDTQPIRLMDMNNSGRAWAAADDQTEEEEE